jgi:hypothetical protein
MASVSSDKVRSQVVALKESEQLTQWEAGFTESLLQWYDKRGSITKKQHDTFQKVLSRYTDEAKEERASWAERYDKHKRTNAELMSHYYLNNPPYFASLARDILKEEGFVPTEKQYKGMCENKYAQKVIALARQTPRFEVGQMVAFRSIPTNGHHEGKLAIVLEHLPEVYSAAKDAKRLKVLLIGETVPTETEERWLKKAKV